MARRKLEINEEVIMDHLPTPPPGHSYTVDQFSKLCYRVWLNHHADYDYACGEEVRSIWGFVKSTGDVMRPKTAEKISSTKVCKLTEITSDMCYTVIKPDLSHPLE